MNEIIYLIIKSFYFILPAYIANMSPVIVKKLRILEFPLDFKIKIKNKRILGEHKTIRGLISGIIGGILVAFIQNYLTKFEFFTNLSIINYDSWILIGFLMGFGAIFGDAIESFIKRQLNIKPGKALVLWDQIDFIIGAILFISIIEKINILIILTTIIISPLLTVIINHISYYLKIRGEKW